MKLTRSSLALALTFSLSLLSFIALPLQTATAQDARVALQRGYRTGYSDGYMAGYRDIIDGVAKSYSRHGEYFEARRAYNKDYGTLEDYQDGYQQGFEAGYDTGFEKRSFEATIPGTLQRRGVRTEAAAAVTNTPAAEPQTQAITEPEPVRQPAAQQEPVSQPAATAAPAEQVRQVSYRPDDAPVVIIPRDTELILELDESLGTETSREGDKFTAKVISPTEIAGAIVEGRVEKIGKPGRIKKRSEMLLSFDRIILSENRWSNFDAMLMEVLPVKGDNVRRVDSEGAAVGKSTIKDDGIKVGGATGAGTVIGAIAGGPVGAAVGAGVGAAFGVGAVVIERGKHIKLASNQQLRIKTSYETRIR